MSHYSDLDLDADIIGPASASATEAFNLGSFSDLDLDQDLDQDLDLDALSSSSNSSLVGSENASLFAPVAAVQTPESPVHNSIRDLLNKRDSLTYGNILHQREDAVYNEYKTNPADLVTRIKEMKKKIAQLKDADKKKEQIILLHINENALKRIQPQPKSRAVSPTHQAHQIKAFNQMEIGPNFTIEQLTRNDIQNKMNLYHAWQDHDIPEVEEKKKQIQEHISFVNKKKENYEKLSKLKKLVKKIKKLNLFLSAKYAAEYKKGKIIITYLDYVITRKKQDRLRNNPGSSERIHAQPVGGSRYNRTRKLHSNHISKLHSNHTRTTHTRKLHSNHTRTTHTRKLPPSDKKHFRRTKKRLFKH